MLRSRSGRSIASVDYAKEHRAAIGPPGTFLDTSPCIVSIAVRSPGRLPGFHPSSRRRRKPPPPRDRRSRAPRAFAVPHRRAGAPPDPRFRLPGSARLSSVGHSSETSPLLGKPDGRSISKSVVKSDTWMLIVTQPPELGVAGSLPGRGATRHAEPRSGDGNPAWVTILPERGRSSRACVPEVLRSEASLP